MNANQLRILAAIAACNARIAAFTAANQQRLSDGNSIAYDETHFFNEANELDSLANEALNS